MGNLQETVEVDGVPGTEDINGNGVVKVIETRAMTLVSGEMVDVLRAADPRAVAIMRQRAEAKIEMLRIAIALTSPRQWVEMAGESGGEPSVYPTGGAADTILRAFGCSWADKETEIVKDETGQPLLAYFRATLRQGDVEIERFEGTRTFGRYVKDLPTLVKGASENMKSRAVRDLFGLRFRSVEDLAALGLDVKKMRRVEFANKTDPDKGDAVEWGKQKGTPLAELGDHDLAWYAQQAEASIADPEKAKWKKSEERRLRSYRREQERRRAAPPSPPPCSTCGWDGEHSPQCAAVRAELPRPSPPSAPAATPRAVAARRSPAPPPSPPPPAPSFEEKGAAVARLVALRDEVGIWMAKAGLNSFKARAAWLSDHGIGVERAGNLTEEQCRAAIVALRPPQADTRQPGEEG